MLNKLFKKNPPKANDTMIFEAQMGGYYTYKNDEGSWSIFRMLDFTVYAIQCTLYKEHFDHKPTLTEAMAARPAILHVPLNKATLFNDKELELLGAKPIKGEDLEGYVVYLQQMGASEAEITDIVARIGNLSRQGAVRLKLTKADDKVETELL